MEQSEDEKKYTRFTYTGYFVMGLASMVLGVVYGILPHFLEYNSSNDRFYLLIDIIIYGIIAIIPSFLFVKIFFDIQKGVSINSKVDACELRQKIISYKKEKKKKNNEKFDVEDYIISSTNKLDANEIAALKSWFYIKEKCLKSVLIYAIIITCVILFLLIQWRNTGNIYLLSLLYFFVSYSLIYIVACGFYTILINNYYIESFQRISYSIFYPTVITIAINMFFGLSIIDFRSQNVNVIWSIIIFILYLISISICEIISYNIKDSKVASKISTICFVCISALGLTIPICVFMFFDNKDIFSDFLFAISIALFLSIFEGWDALRRMNLDETSQQFIHHYKWWTFFQIVQPPIMYIIMCVVNSQIFNTLFIFFYTIISLMGIITWCNGATKEKYESTSWSSLKIKFGFFVIIIVLLMGVMQYLGDSSWLIPKKINLQDLVEFFSISFVIAIGAFFSYFFSKKENSFINVITSKHQFSYNEIKGYTRNGSIFLFLSIINIIFAFLGITLAYVGEAILNEKFKLTNKISAAIVCIWISVIVFFIEWLIQLRKFKNI